MPPATCSWSRLSTEMTRPRARPKAFAMRALNTTEPGDLALCRMFVAERYQGHRDVRPIQLSSCGLSRYVGRDKTPHPETARRGGQSATYHNSRSNSLRRGASGSFDLSFRIILPPVRRRVKRNGPNPHNPQDNFVVQSRRLKVRQKKKPGPSAGRMIPRVSLIRKLAV